MKNTNLLTLTPVDPGASPVTPTSDIYEPVIVCFRGRVTGSMFAGGFHVRATVEELRGWRGDGVDIGLGK